MSKTYSMAIIGIGAIAGMHARAIGDIPQARLLAGSCRSEDKGRKFASDFQCEWFADYVEMLDRVKPEVVTICTPSGLHLEPTLACAQRGIHVLCEKPLEISSVRIDQMIEACQRAGVLLGGIFPQRYNPVVQALHHAAQQGRFGKLAVVNAYVPWWRDDAYYAPSRWQGKLQYDGGGALMNQSIHGIDAVQWLAAATMLPATSQSANPVKEVFAFTAKRGHDAQLIEVEDTAVAVLRFADGSLGQVLGATSMFPGSLKRLQIAGRAGTAEVLEDELITWKFREELASDVEVRQRFGGKTKTGGGAADPMAINYGLHTDNIRAFLQALDTASRPAIDGHEARKAVAIIEAIYQSAATGRMVAVR